MCHLDVCTCQWQVDSSYNIRKEGLYNYLYSRWLSYLVQIHCDSRYVIVSVFAFFSISVTQWYLFERNKYLFERNKYYFLSHSLSIKCYFAIYKCNQTPSQLMNQTTFFSSLSSSRITSSSTGATVTNCPSKVPTAAPMLPAPTT